MRTSLLWVCLREHPCKGIEILGPVGLQVHPCERTGRPVQFLCIPDKACKHTGCPAGLEMDQESIGIVLVYVGVCEGDVGRHDCGGSFTFHILYSIYYIVYSGSRDNHDVCCFLL